YGGFVIHDSAFCAIFAGNLACTAAVSLIAARKRFLFHRLNLKESTMSSDVENLLEKARQSRRNEMKRLFGIAVPALGGAVNRVFAPAVAAPIGFLIPLAPHLGPEDRPGC